MKKEVLRLERVSVEEGGNLLLDNFSLHVFEGEIFGLICFNFHGQDALLGLLQRNGPLHYGFVYLREKLVNAYGKSDLSYNRVLFIDGPGCLADSLTVAENIFVLRGGYKKRMVNDRVLERQVKVLSEETGIQADPARYAGELTFYERCCVSLLKAYATGSRLVVVRDVSQFLNPSDLRAFQRLMRRLAGLGVSFLYLCSRYEEIQDCCDRAAVMEDGRIRKTLDQARLRDRTILAYQAPFDRRLTEMQPGRRSKEEGEEQDKNCILRFRKVCGSRIRDASFSVTQGESLVLQDSDMTVLQELLSLLLGEIRPVSGDILFDRVPLQTGARTRKDIAFIAENPASSMIWPHLSVLDNLCFTADHKLPAIWRSRRIRESVKREYADRFDPACFGSDVMELPVRTRIDIVYQRILLQRPRLVVCVQPFAQTDLYLRGHVLSWLNRIRAEDISLLILTVNRLSALHAADRLLIAEHGRMQVELSREALEKELEKDRTPDW